MRKQSNPNQQLQYRKNVLAALPAEFQIINRLIEQRLLVQEIHRDMEKDHVDIHVFDIEKVDPAAQEPLFVGYVIDVKQVNNKGGQFPRGFEKTQLGNTIIFETRDQNGNLGWGLNPKPQNFYIAIVDGYGWSDEIEQILGEYKTLDELEENDILIRKRIEERFAGMPGKLNHRYYFFDLESLQAFYKRHVDDYDLMPLGYTPSERGAYRRISLSRYAEEGFGYSYWECDNGTWILSTDGTQGEKPPIPGHKITQTFTGRVIPKEEYEEWFRRVRESYNEQQALYALQQRAYTEKSYASKKERIDYLLMKVRLMNQHEWAQYKMDILSDCKDS